MSIKQIFEEDGKIRCLKIKIISKHGDKLIVGDSSCLSILHAPNMIYQDMEVEKCYIIQKPLKKDEHSFVPNEKTKPINITTFNVPDKKQEFKKLKSILTNLTDTVDVKKDSKTNIKIFEDIIAKFPTSEVTSVTAKVINLSKDIQGSYGNYNIVKLKDVANKSIDMNLYKTQLKKDLEIGSILEFGFLKLTQFQRNGEIIHRLATTLRSTCKRSENVDLFENIPLGDLRIDGKVAAIDDIFSYLSCQKCWKKVDDNSGKCSCGNQGNPVNDFHCQFYIEKLNDTDIEVVHTFRRQTGISPNSLEIEKIQRELNDKFLMKTFTFEWNVDNESDTLKMVKIVEK